MSSLGVEKRLSTRSHRNLAEPIAVGIGALGTSAYPSYSIILSAKCTTGAHAIDLVGVGRAFGPAVPIHFLKPPLAQAHPVDSLLVNETVVAVSIGVHDLIWLASIDTVALHKFSAFPT